MAFVVGLDWGGALHAVCVIDRESGAVADGTVRNSVREAMMMETERTIAWLLRRAFGPTPGGP